MYGEATTACRRPRPLVGLSAGITLIVVSAALAACDDTAASSAAAPKEQEEQPAARATTTPPDRPSHLPSPTPDAVTMWVTGETALLGEPGDLASVQARVGADFPVVVTSGSATTADGEWQEVNWETPGRAGTAWVRADVLTAHAPAGRAAAQIDALDEDLSRYLTALGDDVGVSVVDIRRATTYGHNADRQFIAASSVKVPIMLAYLHQVETEGRSVTPEERALLAAMIRRSDNDAATKLYAAIGAEVGMAAYLAEIGVDGLRPEGFRLGWGWSRITPAAMVHLLELTHTGQILSDEHRALALELMRNPEPHLRYGVGDTAPSEATVAMKTGHVPGPVGMAVNSSGIVSLGENTYIVAVYTDRNSSLEAGKEILRKLSSVVAEHLLDLSQ